MVAHFAPSPNVVLNRAVAVAMAMAFGPATGLEMINRLTSEPSLQSYRLLTDVRGDFLVNLGRLDDAHGEHERAASLTRNAREHELLLERAAEAARRSDVLPGTPVTGSPAPRRRRR